MQYEVTIIDVKDADAIVINYHDGNRWWTAVVDAGNVGDANKVKSYVKHKENNKYIIDYAFCTHPDKDHKGGFFELLADSHVEICNFYIRRPDTLMRNDYRRLLYNVGELENAAKAVYNHPTDSTRNLIDEAIKHSHLVEPTLGLDVVGMPLMVIGPRPKFFQDACYQMAISFAELENETDAENYAEDELPTEEEAKSVMDEVKEESPTNKSSLILLFHPNGRNFLLAGDACSATLMDAVEDYPQSVPDSALKVPHHGSKHNLTTEVIDMLKPSSAVISAKGSKKHPNRAVVHFLSKHCNVYSTSKSGTLTYQSEPVTRPAEALRKKTIKYVNIMNFKYYDVLSTLISGVVLLFVLSIVIDWNISNINVTILLSLAYVMGYMLNALSALLEPLYYWFMGGKPSDKLLKAPKPNCCGKIRNYTGFGRIRFYEYEKAIKSLKQELNDDKANEGKMFGKAMSYSNSNEKTRVPDFNAQYAFSRVMLTLAIVSVGVIMPKFCDLWWAWLIALAVILLVGRRYKERGYYYAREVLIEYLKTK